MDIPWDFGFAPRVQIEYYLKILSLQKQTSPLLLVWTRMCVHTHGGGCVVTRIPTWYAYWYGGECVFIGLPTCRQYHSWLFLNTWTRRAFHTDVYPKSTTQLRERHTNQRDYASRQTTTQTPTTDIGSRGSQTTKDIWFRQGHSVLYRMCSI